MTSGSSRSLARRWAGSPLGGDFSRNVHAPEAVASVQKVMRLAQQTNVLCVGCAVSRKGFDVVKLDECPRIAPSTVGRDE